MIALFRTALTIVVAAVLTFVFASAVIIAALLGVKDRPGGLYDRLPRIWAQAILWAAGASVSLEAHAVPVVVPPHERNRQPRKQVEDALAANVTAVQEVLRPRLFERRDARGGGEDVIVRVAEDSHEHGRPDRTPSRRADAT